MRELFSWIFKILIVAAITFLYFRVYPVNSTFFYVIGGFLLLILLASGNVKVLLFSDKFVIRSYHFFNLFYRDKAFSLNEIKEIIIAGNYKTSNVFYDLLIPYANTNRSNEIRVIYQNGEIKTFFVEIYLDDLQQLEAELGKLLNKK